MKRTVIASLIFMYCVGLLCAELLLVYLHSIFGLVTFFMLLMFTVFMVILAAWYKENDFFRLALTLLIPPCIRIVSISMPSLFINPMYSLLFIYASISILALLVMVLLMIFTKMTLRNFGLVIGNIKIQFMIAMTGFIFGVIEYFILEPPTLIGSITFWVILSIISIFIFTGFVEELIFRGMILTNAERILGKTIGLIFVSVLFATMHIIWRDPIDIIFVFGIALFYGYVFLRTRSISGIALSHGIASIMLFVVMPLIGRL